MGSTERCDGRLAVGTSAAATSTLAAQCESSSDGFVGKDAIASSMNDIQPHDNSNAPPGTNTAQDHLTKLRQQLEMALQRVEALEARVSEHEADQRELKEK